MSVSSPGAIENLLARLQGFLEANLEVARDIRRDIRIDNLAPITRVMPARRGSSTFDGTTAASNGKSVA